MQPGDPITSSIRLIKPLGQGGMGSVWLATHSGLKCEVVVKFILEEVKGREDVRARFEREASLLAMAKSPHVVQIYDHGISLSGLPYIAMEHLVGEDLETRMRREGRIEPRLFGEWFRQACNGLARAHSKGIVHRDLKPANLFLVHEDDGIVVKILDFGIAKGSSSREELFATTAGALLGTAFYMSPEQARGRRDVDLRSDLWSMGVLAYHALTGQLPFNGETIASLALAIVQQDFRRPSEVLPSLPRSLDAWMERALAKDAERRFPSARTLADELNVVLDEVSILPPGRGSYPSPTPVPSDGTRGGTTLSPAVTGASLGPSAEFWNTRPLPQRLALGTSALIGVGLAVFGAFTLISKPSSQPKDDPTVSSRPTAIDDERDTGARQAEPPKLDALSRPGTDTNEPKSTVEGDPLHEKSKSSSTHRAKGNAPHGASSHSVVVRPEPSDTVEQPKTSPKSERTLDMPLH